MSVSHGAPECESSPSHGMGRKRGSPCVDMSHFPRVLPVASEKHLELSSLDSLAQSLPFYLKRQSSGFQAGDLKESCGLSGDYIELASTDLFKDDLHSQHFLAHPAYLAKGKTLPPHSAPCRWAQRRAGEVRLYNQFPHLKGAQQSCPSLPSNALSCCHPLPGGRCRCLISPV